MGATLHESLFKIKTKSKLLISIKLHISPSVYRLLQNKRSILALFFRRKKIHLVLEGGVHTWREAWSTNPAFNRQHPLWCHKGAVYIKVEQAKEVTKRTLEKWILTFNLKKTVQDTVARGLGPFRVKNVCCPHWLWVPGEIAFKKDMEHQTQLS